MSQVITNAFEQYWQSSLAAEQPVVLDEFILADIPNLDITSTIDPETGLPPESQIVHRQNVDQRGRINNNAVAYTIVMDTTVGDFSFNAMYLRNKQNGVIGMIVYKGRETKLKTNQTTGQVGNSLVKSMLMGYDQAAEATLTHVDAGTWQIDYAARLRGQDEDLRQLASQLYGHHTFVGDGFNVVEKDGAYQVSQGVAIVGGLRVELKAPEVIHPGTKPIGVWVDVHRAGSLLSEHQNHFTIITSVADLTDHVDSNGYQHYVAKLATVLADGTIEDGRGNTSSGEKSIPDALARLEQADDMLNIASWGVLHRSYAEAGYNLRPQPESFRNGGTLTSATDVLWDEASGKAFSGPIGHVAAKTNPEAGGFVDRSDALLLKIWLDEARNFKTFGATGLGLVDDAPALQEAIDWAGAKEGRRVYGDSGAEYLFNTGLILKYDGKSGFDLSSSCVLDFTGTKLIPNRDNMFGLAISRNHATVIRPTVHNKHKKTGIICYIIGPHLLDDAPMEVVSSRWSEWTRPVGIGCDHGFIFQPGPTVGGVASGCFYHTLYSPFFIKTGVGFWFKSNVTHDVKPTRCHIYSPRQHSGNCMFDIDSAESLRVYSGTADLVREDGKYATKPTIRISKQAAEAIDNGLIAFYDFVGEAGGVPYELDGALFKVVFPNARFINYATPLGTISGTSNPAAQIWANEGPVYSVRENADRALPRLGVRWVKGATEDIGSKVTGEAYLEWEPSATTYPARLRTGGKGLELDSVGLSLLVGATGMKVSGGPVTRMDLQDGRNLTSNIQRLGTDSCHANISGSTTDNDFRFYNVNAGVAGNGFVFGGADLKYLSTYDRDNYTSLGRASFRWSTVYAGTGTINTSDAHDKTAPLPIDDTVLDAWGDVQLITYQWLESIRQKGDDAREHFGVIAQQVRDAFVAHGLDGTKYGLLCYDEWGDVYEPIMAEREVIGTQMVENSETGEQEEVSYTFTEIYDTGEVKQTQVAGNRWGIRPDQCLFVEAAYQRRERNRDRENFELFKLSIETRLAALESK